ncbi:MULTISPECIES: copper resistance system multicopper oxidase [unclassified Caballeronia]|uniref:copper resistance system multicopper oxidase n=1 Tax=unclassified Caballeronia TaxID=2646786 RepID=UPI001FCFAEC6|nr:MULTISPECIES: copper resistance system multicopper oxidase [unclassified Caballeronia]MDR5880516.1 copper resistance system multicopper oxidase [Caballeronia sp. LZ032]
MSKKQNVLPNLTNRRRFVQGVTASGLAAGLGAWPLLTRADGYVSHGPSVLTGTDFDLVIGSTLANYTGRIRPTTSVNGSIPAPELRWRQGTEVTMRVTNRLQVPTSIHWHGILVPFDMDGVPGISFPGIQPGQTFTYRFLVRQAGTFWYHSHSRFQEQTGLYGPLVIEPAGGESIRCDRDYVVMLSDWTDENPERIMQKLKLSSDYYNFQMPTAPEFFDDVRKMGLGAALKKRKMWNEMRMNPTDFHDVSGATYTYLANGTTPAKNWTAVARAGEKVRLRFINGSSETLFDVRIPGLKMTVVAADGQEVRPVTVDEFRISVAETYDVLVDMPDDNAHTIFCQSMDRSGFARATLAPHAGMEAAIPPMDPKTWLSMGDMGMGEMSEMQGMSGAKDARGMGGMDHTQATSDAKDMDSMRDMHGANSMPSMNDKQGMSDMQGMQGMQRMQDDAGMQGMEAVQDSQSEDTRTDMKAGGMGEMARGTGPEVDMRPMAVSRSLEDPGPRLRESGRKVLTYADLHTAGGPLDTRPPSREIAVRLTGNMERFIWGFDGQKFSEAPPILFHYGERLRVTLINDTMMNHPIHLHGMFMELESEDGSFLVRKHTINVQPTKQVTFRVTADAPGQWAFHCHLLYHMEAGMFRKVVVA